MGNRSNPIIPPMPAIRGFLKSDSSSQAPNDPDNISACDRPSSFRAISQYYFAKEAPQHFVREALLFFVMMMTAALPLLNTLIEASRLVRARPPFTVSRS
jgi:hypothetical protein